MVMLTKSEDVLMLLLMMLVGLSSEIGCVDESRSRKAGKPGPMLNPPRDKDICLDSRSINDIQCDTQSDRDGGIYGAGNGAHVPHYRTIDGTCNNVRHPLWGASHMPLKRLLSPVYEDEKTTPIGWSEPPKKYHGFVKPNPREVTLRVLKARPGGSGREFHERYTDFVTLWGQFIDHDIDLTSKEDTVCSHNRCKKKAPFCFPILPAVGDPRLRRTDCIPLTRSFRVCNDSLSAVRQQQNGITSFLDASMIYGSTQERAEELRDLSDDRGYLKIGDADEVHEDSEHGYLMPFADKSQKQDCLLSKMDESGIRCFFGGDRRANEHLSLIALHTIWLREHNRIAEILNDLNPHWNGDRTYQETRKIIGAVVQHVSYTHWLPYVVGDMGMEWLSKYKGYDSSIDPSISNVFATAAFRYGHFTVNSKVFRLYNHSDLASFRSANGSIDLHEGAFTPYRIRCEGGVDPVLRGVFGTPMKDVSADNILAEEVTEHFLELARASLDVASDLGSLDIQRGRDHGLPGYQKWREFCSNFAPKKQTIYKSTVLDNFDDLADEVKDDDVRDRLHSLYGHPGNVDLHVAGLLEDPMNGGLLGPTYTCLVIEQMRRTRDGDRFWYENPGVFSVRQLGEIKRHSLARVLCDSGDDIKRVQGDVFLRASYPKDYVACDEIPSMDLRQWTDDGR